MDADTTTPETEVMSDDTAEDFKPIGTATYSAEDNKLRLSAFARLDQETYERVKAAGFKWAPKQEIFVAPMWTPAREDLLLELCGEIDDEDYSATERAADRAERFSGYRDKRATEAGASADRFDAGPQAFGHQSLARAERQARRHDRHRTYAVSQWSKAEYWQSRTAGVIANALHRANPRTRRGRIKVLEAEQRKHEKERAEYAQEFAKWSEVLTLDGADVRPTFDDDGRIVNPTPAYRLAYSLANYGGGWGDYTHPRTGEKRSLYSHLTNEADPITPAEAAAMWLKGRKDPSDETSYNARWSRHYENRLTYERAMLANEGGTAADAEMVPGGWIGKSQIQAVNKSPVTGKVVSVKVFTTKYERQYNPANGGEMQVEKTVLKSFNIERLPEGAYRAPTPEELEAFTTATKQAKAEKKATAPKAPSLINPTDADAQKLQDHWNRLALAKFNEKKRYGTEYKPAEVLRMTQAEYSERSKGEYALCETRELHDCGKPARRYSNMWTAEGSAYDKSLGATVAKIRVRGVSDFHTTDRVIVLTDKPQKPLPLDWQAIENGTAGQPKAEPADNPADYEPELSLSSI